MRFDIDEELLLLAQLQHNQLDAPATAPTIEGACWALSRVTGRATLELITYVRDGARRLAAEEARRTATLPGLVAPAPPMPAAPVPPPVAAPPAAPPSAPGSLLQAVPYADEPVGYYPGLGPVIKWAEEPREADLSQPPAPPTEDSLDHLSRLAAENGSPAALPMDDETLAAVDAELAQARERARQDGSAYVPPPDIPGRG